MNNRLTLAFVLLLFFPFVGYEVSKLNAENIAKLYCLLGYVILMATLVTTGYNRNNNG